MQSKFLFLAKSGETKRPAPRNLHNKFVINNNKCVSNAPNHSVTIYTCVRLKALYMKHYNNTQPNLITHSISHFIPHPLLHPHTHTPPPLHTHTISQPLASPSLSQYNPPVPPTPPTTTTTTKNRHKQQQQQQQNHQSASEDVSSQTVSIRSK